MGSTRRVELCLERRVDRLKEIIDLLAPLRHEPAFSEQRLRLLLKPGGIAAADPVQTGLSPDLGDPGHNLQQFAFW